MSVDQSLNPRTSQRPYSPGPITLDDLSLFVIMRHERLGRLIKMDTPEIIVRNERRMLRAAINALLDEGVKYRNALS